MTLPNGMSPLPTRRSLLLHARAERRLLARQATPDQSIAEAALAAGYADQSHMGRDIRRLTGFSPARIGILIATEEAFWCYRLLARGL